MPLKVVPFAVNLHEQTTAEFLACRYDLGSKPWWLATAVAVTIAVTPTIVLVVMGAVGARGDARLAFFLLYTRTGAPASLSTLLV